MRQEVGRTIPQPAFPDDTGASDPELAAAVEAYAGGRVPAADLLARLAGARVLVPVVAVLDDAVLDDAVLDDAVLDDAVPTSDTGGISRREKESHLAAVSTTSGDGRRGLLAFTGADSMTRWDPAARPVPVTGAQAAQAALADGAEALVVDLAGPVRFAVERPELDVLAVHG